MDIQSYGSAISAVTPGTFVPDMTPAAAAPSSQPLTADAAPDAASGASFKDTVQSYLSNVNDQLVAAGTQSVDLATGKSNDFEGTVKAVEQAGLAFSMTMSVRNKLMDAYNEIEQMQF